MREEGGGVHINTSSLLSYCMRYYGKYLVGNTIYETILRLLRVVVVAVAAVVKREETQ